MNQWGRVACLTGAALFAWCTAVPMHADAAGTASGQSTAKTAAATTAPATTAPAKTHAVKTPAKPKTEQKTAAPKPGKAKGGKAGQAAPAKPTQAGKAEAAAKEMEAARASFESVSRKHVDKAIRNLPSAQNKKVEQRDGSYVASYYEVDTTSMVMELTEHNLPGSKYVGNVAYVVHEFQCKGTTAAEAQAASCSKVKSRRMREYARYDKGKWIL